MFFDRALETLPRAGVEQLQLHRLRGMLKAIHGANRFYTQKLDRAGIKADGLGSLTDLSTLPFTTKQELAQDQLDHLPFGTNLTYSLDSYIKFHQTSGTTGKPIKWLETESCWQWWARCWSFIYRGAGVGPGDRVFVAFSFGPFLGFWSAWEGARTIGALALTGGGQDSLQRLDNLMENGASVLVCTPTYALRLAEVARERGIDIRGSQVRITIHAGEPGANIPATKRRIEELWGARCFDHTGATEVGAYGFECMARPGGVHVNESEFICEVIDPWSGKPLAEGERGELVMTNLGRLGMPIIRYRTGDLVEPVRLPCPCGRSFVWLRGGILGRVDDMVTVRGVNVFPSAIEDIVRGFGEVEEFRLRVSREGTLDELDLDLEAVGDGIDSGRLQRLVQERIHLRLGIRARVAVVAPGTLPRFELKAKRLLRSAPSAPDL